MSARPAFTASERARLESMCAAIARISAEVDRLVEPVVERAMAPGGTDFLPALYRELGELPGDAVALTRFRVGAALAEAESSLGKDGKA